MTGVLAGKVALVTGAGSGIGQATALVLAGEGAQVVAADINLDSAAETVRQIEGGGGKALAVAVDVTREEEVARMVEAAVDRFGRLDGAFNNAGIGPKQGPTGGVELADWSRVIAVNLTGVMLCMKHEINAMAAAGGGAIVNMASTAGLQGVPMQAAYSASKHGVLGLTKTASAEYGPAGIRVNAICAGAVETPATKAFGIDWNAVVPSPMGRIAQPDEVAEIVVWLLSSKSSFITGQSIIIDGGRIATSFVPPQT